MLVPDDFTALVQKRKYSPALNILVETCGRKVFGMAIAMLGNEARAEETTQDVFLKVWRRIRWKKSANCGVSPTGRSGNTT